MQNIHWLYLFLKMIKVLHSAFFLLNFSPEKNSFSKTIISTREQSTMSFKVKIYRIQKDITLGFLQLEGKKSLQEKGRC